jgi:hypothetical protein
MKKLWVVFLLAMPLFSLFAQTANQSKGMGGMGTGAIILAAIGVGIGIKVASWIITAILVGVAIILFVAMGGV